MLRGLKTSDIFRMSKILKKMNLKDEINRNSNDEKKTTNQIGTEIILTAFENLHLAEDEINAFLADLAGMEPKDFAELPVEKTLEIMQEFRKMPGLTSFFKQANQ